MHEENHYLHYINTFWVVKQGRRGHWTVYYTSPQSFIIRISYSLTQIRFRSVNSLSVQTFQPLIVIYRRGKLLKKRWGCRLIYRPFSYPFRSLGLTSLQKQIYYLNQMASILVLSLIPFYPRARQPWTWRNLEPV